MKSILAAPMIRPLAVAVLLCVSVAALEGLLGAEGLDWYAGLTMPWWHVPIPLFIAVAVAVYVINGFIAFRLCSIHISFQQRIASVSLLAGVMVFNALWTWALFQTQNLAVGVAGIVAFILPLLTLQFVTYRLDRVSALALLPYSAWVVLYDLPLYIWLWRLNP